MTYDLEFKDSALKEWRKLDGGIREQFKKKLFGLGTSLNYSCGEWESNVSLAGLNANLWASLRLMNERFTAPNIEPDMLKRMVEVQIGAHADAKKDPETVFNALSGFAFFVVCACQGVIIGIISSHYLRSCRC